VLQSWLTLRSPVCSTGTGSVEPDGHCAPCPVSDPSILLPSVPRGQNRGPRMAEGSAGREMSPRLSPSAVTGSERPGAGKCDPRD
jgi:hypothetical protein